MRIIQRVREEYGGDAGAHIAEEKNPFTNPNRAKKALEAITETDSTLRENPFSYGDDNQDIGGGFLVNDDDLDQGPLLPEGHDKVEIQHGAGGLVIEDGKGPVDIGPLNGAPSANSDVMNHGPLKIDDHQWPLIEADLGAKVITPQRTSTTGKEAFATILRSNINVSTDSLRRRAAPKRKAASKSEKEFESRLFEYEDDDDDKSERGNVRRKEAAVKKPAKRQKNKNGSGPSLRARKGGY